MPAEGISPSPISISAPPATHRRQPTERAGIAFLRPLTARRHRPPRPVDLGAASRHSQPRIHLRGRKLQPRNSPISASPRPSRHAEEAARARSISPPSVATTGVTCCYVTTERPQLAYLLRNNRRDRAKWATAMPNASNAGATSATSWRERRPSSRIGRWTSHIKDRIKRGLVGVNERLRCVELLLEKIDRIDRDVAAKLQALMKRLDKSAKRGAAAL